jgi:hypothetical protein
MQLDNLQIELRPRSNAQALDLGQALLRSCAGDAYKAWLAVWLPVIALCFGAQLLLEEQKGWSILLLWWLKPLVERAPLFVLSRKVFGQAVSWQEAVRAWPRQLGGGWFGLLSWRRLFAAPRCLRQPVWQLEQARGKAASARYAVLSRNSASSSATLFGIVCFGFEVILALGTLSLLGTFVSGYELVNPFAALSESSTYFPLLMLSAYAIGTCMMGPIYTACGLTLYLNRRATLEAWDIEIILRQIRPPAQPRARHGSAAAVLAPLLATLLLGSILLQGTPALAAPTTPAVPAKPAAAELHCEPPEETGAYELPQLPAHAPAQAELRKQVARVYASAELRGYRCKLAWELKNTAPKPKAKTDTETPAKLPNLDWLAQILKAIVICAAIGVVAWLLYRYRDHLPQFGRRPPLIVATEVGGLDIRPESLPDDVASRVRALWAEGQFRAALGLLYRATLSRLVEHDGLVLPQGATEGDCLRLARQARAAHKLSQEKLDVAAAVTATWLAGAYGNRWPGSDTVEQHCAAWHTEFERKPARRA